MFAKTYSANCYIDSMRRSRYIFIFLLTFFIGSCNKSNKYPYAIKDFPKKLQPYLVRIIQRGIVMSGDSALAKLATDSELERLGNSEHPILRAAAYREMLDRSTFNHYDIIIKHLDDTALVFVDGGEFGIWSRTVSDDILQEARWKTLEDKTRTVDLVLTQHNYLRSAYTVLQELEPKEKYYPFIKDMATRDRRLDTTEDFELDFGDIECALYGLARFRKKEDAPIIKNKLLKYFWRMTDVSFQLMKNYPDTSYFDVLQVYHRRQFYKFSGNRPHGFTGFPADNAAPEDFIQAVVAQQTDRSASLLDSMLTILPQRNEMPDKKAILNELITAIWENPCPAYIRLRERIRPQAEALAKWNISILIDSSEIYKDTTNRGYRWHP